MLETLSAVMRQILKAPKAKPAAGDHRGATRYAMRARVAVQLMSVDARNDGKKLNLWLRDISSAGVGLMHTASLKPGQEILVHIPDLEELSPLVGKVVRCERMSPEVFVIGAAFITGLSAQNRSAHAVAALTGGQLTRVTAQASVRNEAAPVDPAAAARAVAEQVLRSATGSPTPTALATLDRKFVWVNAAFIELLGHRADALSGQPIERFTHPDDVRLDAPLAQRMAAGSLASFQSTKRFLHKDGSAVAIALSNVLLRDANSRPLFLLATAESTALAPAVTATVPAIETPTFAPVSTTQTRDSDEAERIRRAMFD